MARVAVVRGGRSLEREISLRSGHHVAAALADLGHDPVEIDVDERLGPQLASCDAVFVALHGRDGEDGTLQEICEAMGVSYTGSTSLACQISFDKAVGKALLAEAGIAVPQGYVVSAEAVRRMGAGAAVRKGAERLGFPVVVKPVTQGSALGVGVVEGPDELSAAAMAAFNYADRVLLERFVAGTELAVTVVGAEKPAALPPVEIRTPRGIFDFESRVSPGGSDFVCPPEVPDSSAAAAREAAERAAETLRARDFARVDMILGDDGPQVLEVNPCPGLTESSLLPLAVAEAGMSFQDFVGTVVDAALSRRA